MKTASPTVAAVLALGAHGLACAETGPSLYEARRGIIHGTSKGIPIFEPSPKRAASAPGTSAAASAAGTATARAAAVPVDRFAPSGTALPAAKRLEAEDLGTPLPTGTPARKTR